MADRPIRPEPARSSLGERFREVFARSPKREQGSHQEVDRYRRVTRLHLRYSRLTRANPSRDRSLAEPLARAALLERAAERELQIDQRGFFIGETQEFLSLSDEEAALIDLKLALGRALKERRTRQRLSQAAVAARIRSSQSRVAKMESGDSTVSIDLLVRTLLALGASRKDLAKSLT